MSPEKESLDPKLERALIDDNGRVICTCRGTVREVFSCFNEKSAFRIGGAEAAEGAGNAHAAQFSCAIEGIQEVSKGFTEKPE